MKKLTTTFCFLFVIVSLFAASVDSLQVYSVSMKKHVPVVVVMPTEGIAADKKVPALYLLHGAFGKYNNWIIKVPAIKQLADKYGMMIVCPDGGHTSWYFDSPIDSTYRYETFITKELIAYIDTNYPTIANRNGRAITGLSMGGHGGIFLTYRHPNLFSACGSTSGALHVSVITRGYDVEKRLGDPAANPSYWKDWSVLNIIENKPIETFKIIIDCGTEDRVLPMNRAVHEKMLQLKIPHEYIERPGGHDFNYWAESIHHQALFFYRHFQSVAGS